MSLRVKVGGRPSNKRTKQTRPEHIGASKLIRPVRWSWSKSKMPEICRFFGIIIRMFVEAGGVHHKAHFHAYYEGKVGIYGIDPIERLAGELPNRQERLVLAWAELHQHELQENWETLQEGRPPSKIEPLR